MKPKNLSVGEGELDVPTPVELRNLSEEAEMAEVRASLAKMRKEEEEHNKMREAFMTDPVPPHAIEDVLESIRRAAKSGKRELMVMKFPSSFCSDGGRAINNQEYDWPKTLAGAGKRGYEIYETLFKPRNYKLRAQILNYPDGMLGDVGLFLSW